MTIRGFSETFAIIFGLAGLLFLPAGATAQSPSKVDDCDAFLHALSERYHVALIVEAEPLRPTLTQEKRAALAGEITDSTISETQAIEKVADAFDYEAERTASDLVLLRKRYTDPTDLPFVTFDEVRYDLAALLRSLSPLAPATPDVRGPGTLRPGPYLVRRFEEALSPEQIAAMPQGIPVGQLPAEARARAWDFARNSYAGGGLKAVHDVLDLLERTQRKEATFHWIDEYGLLAFGFTTFQSVTTTSGVVRLARNFPLSHGLRASVNGGILVNVPKETVQDNYFVSTPPDPTAPNDKALPELAKVSAAASLATVVERVNRIQAKTMGKGFVTSGDASSAIASVDAALAPKPVTLVGCERLPPDRLLSAVAAVYGLRLEVTSTGHLRVTYRRPATLALRNLPESILRYLPDSLVRFWHGNQTAAENSSLAERKAKGQTIDHFQIAVARAKGSMVAPEASRTEAIRRLRQTVQPRVSSPKGRLPMTDLSPTERRYLALIALADCQTVLYRITTNPVPIYISDFDRTVIQGGFEAPPSDIFQLWVNYYDEGGNLSQGANGGVSLSRRPSSAN